jgi:hypothetical protein
LDGVVTGHIVNKRPQQFQCEYKEIWLPGLKSYFHCIITELLHFFIPDTLNTLSDFLKNNQKPILMLGLGSNLLVRDRGFSGVIIQLG